MGNANIEHRTSNIEHRMGEVESPHGRHARLRPCPNPRCRAKGASVKTLGGVVYMVYCPECCLTGPEGETAREAAAVWNCLPQPMRVVCSGCQKILKEGNPELAASHGMCRECTAAAYGEEMAREVFDKGEGRNVERRTSNIEHRMEGGRAAS